MRAATLSMPLEGAHLCTETRGFNVPLILVMPVSRLYREVDQLEGEATPYFMPVATLESPLLFNFGIRILRNRPTTMKEQ